MVRICRFFRTFVASLVRGRLSRGALVVLALPLVVVALWQVVQLGQTFWGRFNFPMDLEWMEGGQLYHAYRLLHGQAVYGDCLDGFIPFPYPPMHITVLAAVGALFGLDYGVARLVSIAAFSICCLVLCREVYIANRSRTRGAVLVIAALAGIASGYPLIGAWYDIIRVDAVFIAILFTAAALTLPHRRLTPPGRRLSPVRITLCAFALTAAIFAKQTAVFFLPWICLYAIWRDWRSGVRLSLALALIGAAVLGILLWVTEGRFWTLIFTIMSRHEFTYQRSLWNALRLLVLAPFLPVVPVLAIVLWRRRRLRRRTVFWLGMLACAIVASLVTSTKAGAHINNLMTAVVLCWPVSLMVVSDLLKGMQPRSSARFLWAATLSVVAAFLLNGLRFDPRGYVPSAQRWTKAGTLNGFVATLEGGVLFPAHSFVPIHNGQHYRQFHRQGYVDPMEADLRQFDYEQCLRGIDAEWLIVSLPPHPYFGMLLLSVYEPYERLPAGARMDGGGYGFPEWLFRRRKNDLTALNRARRRVLFDFESGSYARWQQQGRAFRSGPSAGRRQGQWPVLSYQGRWVANSYDPDLGDEATGQLRSESFEIDRKYLGFQVGGGAEHSLKVALEVDGEQVLVLGGAGSNVDLLLPAVWDVSAFRGKQGAIVIDDGDRQGHIVVDQFELFDSSD